MILVLTTLMGLFVVRKLGEFFLSHCSCRYCCSCLCVSTSKERACFEDSSNDVEDENVFHEDGE